MATIEGQIGAVRNESMTPLLLQYTYLQLLDLLTTIAFLIQGVREANPIVRLCLNAVPNPVVALLLVKAAAIALAVYCVRAARRRLLGRINLMFAALVAWNLVALIVASVSR